MTITGLFVWQKHNFFFFSFCSLTLKNGVWGSAMMCLFGQIWIIVRGFTDFTGPFSYCHPTWSSAFILMHTGGLMDKMHAWVPNVLRSTFRPDDILIHAAPHKHRHTSCLSRLNTIYYGAEMSWNYWYCAKLLQAMLTGTSEDDYNVHPLHPNPHPSIKMGHPINSLIQNSESCLIDPLPFMAEGSVNKSRTEMNSDVNVRLSFLISLTKGVTDDCFSARLPLWVKTRGFMMHGHPL